MRDINRIHPIMKEFEKFWEKNPDLRFWQLISMLQNGNDRIYVEDDVTLKLFKELNKEIT